MTQQDWEEKFALWSKPPGKTEREKMENAEAAVRKAIDADAELSKMDISVFPQGSYKARTNITQDSDVDICVRLNSTFFVRYPEGKTKEDYGHSTGSITFSNFKSLVGTALTNYFGKENITPGNKAFDIHSNSYRVDADAIPTFSYRYYLDDGSDKYIQPVGTGFNTNDKKRIYNWPKQSYENGVAKQGETSDRFKKIVRILKKLRNEMQGEGIKASEEVASFLIESIVWNAPDSSFGHDTLYSDVREVLAYCFNQTIEDDKCNEWREVNGIKYLFRAQQPWTRETAHDFLSAAWDYVDFK